MISKETVLLVSEAKGTRDINYMLFNDDLTAALNNWFVWSINEHQE
jgi:hypothetical protein